MGIAGLSLGIAGCTGLIRDEDPASKPKNDDSEVEPNSTAPGSEGDSGQSDGDAASEETESEPASSDGPDPPAKPTGPIQQLDREWSADIGGPPFGESNETVFVRGEGLTALDGPTGSRLWQVRSGWTDSMYPSIDDRAYYGWVSDVPSNGGVVALDSDGTRRWTDETSGVFAPPIVTDKSVVVAGTTGVVSAFSRATGRTEWQRSLPGVDANDLVTSFTAGDGTLYCTAAENAWAVGMDGGTLEWQAAVENGFGDDLLARDERLYISGGDLRVLEDGTQRWSVSGDEPIELHGVVDDRVYVTRGRTLQARDAGDGTIRWRYPNVDAVTVDGTAIVASDSVVALDANGNEAWSIKLEGAKITTLDRFEDGLLALTPEKVYAVHYGGTIQVAAVPNVEAVESGTYLYASTEANTYAFDVS
nr:PQQ-binding-like beta-propeller repeat protein [Halovivax limisalsi]